MNDLRTAAQQALDALIHMCHNTVAEKGYDGQRVQNAIDGLEAALAQQEPVAWPEGYEPHELPADYTGKLWIEGQVRHLYEAALEQQEQEPVTWGVDWGRDGDQSCCTIIKRHADGVQEVVAVEYGPPRREWVSLTEEEVWSQYQTLWPLPAAGDIVKFARAVEQALKERNNG